MLTVVKQERKKAATEKELPPDGWKLERAAEFLGISTRTLERYVARRMVPCIIYESARGESGKPIVVFDPWELAAWRDEHKVGRAVRVS